MYFLNDYGRMIADNRRFAAYQKAIARTVRPGDTALEIGCGPGLFALLACQAGASKVYAIDTEQIVHLARELAVANGFGDRSEFRQIDSREFDLPGRADVIMSDLRGSLPLFSKAITTLNDARERLLAPRGRMIPQRDTLNAALIEAEEYYSNLVRPWSKDELGLNLSRARKAVLNAQYTTEFRTGQMLSEQQAWTVLDYALRASPSPAGDFALVATRPGTAHGLCLWFDTVLIDEIGFSSGPAAGKNVYGQVFLPWLEPVHVQEGQCIRVRLKANLVGDDYVWCWDTEIPAHEDQPARRFSQSTLQGAILSPESLRRRAAGFVPSLSEQGRADRYLLDLMDGRATLQQVAQSAAAKFPAIFARWEDALSRAADLAAQSSR